MRQGQNPAKFIRQVAKPHDTTVVVITQFPSVDDPARQAETLSRMLSSLRQEDRVRFDVMVFDNGSHASIVEALAEHVERGLIQYLVLSKNVLTRTRMWELVFDAAPGSRIAYSEGEFGYLPGWLYSSSSILDTYPKAGMVSALPFRQLEAFSRGLAVLDDLAQHKPGMAHLLKDLTCSHDPACDLEEGALLLDKDGVLAQAGSSGKQFVAHKATLIDFLRDREAETEIQSEELVRWMLEVNLLCLSTPCALAASGPGALETLSQQIRLKMPRVSLRRRILQWPPIRSGLLRVHDWIFRLYFERPERENKVQ